MAERPGGGRPEGAEPTSATREERNRDRKRGKNRRRDRRRGGRTGEGGAAEIEVVRRPGAKPEASSTPAAPTPEAPVTTPTTSPDTTRPAASPDTSKGAPDTRPPSVDTADDDDDSVDTPATSPTPPSSPLPTPPPAPTAGAGDIRYIFVPGGEGIDDKAKKWFGLGGKGLGFLGLGILGSLAHVFRVAARTTHHVYDGALYYMEKFVYENSGAKNTIPWKWFIKEPSEPEYIKARKRLEEMQKRTGGGGGKK